MSKRLVLSALLGGLVVFIWGAISWCVFPWHHWTMNMFNDEHAVSKVIMQNAPVSGSYMLPNCMGANKYGDEEERNAWEDMKERYMHGPIVFSTVKLHGKNPNMVGELIIQLINQIVAAALISVVLMRLKFNKTQHKAAMSCFLGFIGAILVYGPSWNWGIVSGCYALVGTLDLIIGWLIAGFVMAKILK